jgi:iron complex outermembrane receptor protein
MKVRAQEASTDLYYQFHNTRRTHNVDNYASGYARLSVALPKSTEFFVGAGTTGRVPDAVERYISRGMATPNTGNPLLPITRNTEVTAGWSLNRNRIYLRPSYFYSFVQNFILVNNQPLLNMSGMGGGMNGGMIMNRTLSARSYTNVDARMHGGEMAYGLTLTNTLSLNGGTSYSRATIAQKARANVLSRNLPEMPPLRGWGALRYTRTWAFAELSTVAANRQSRVNSDLRELPTAGYAVASLKLGMTHRKFSCSFAIENLFNRFYYEHLSYYRDPFSAGVKIPEPGRNFFVQLRYAL